MRLLVTGGAGYIGSIVAQQLVARGDDVVVLDSLYRGHREAVPAGARRCWTGGAWREVPFFDRALLKPGAAFAGPSLVFESHSATLIEEGWRGRVDGAASLVLERVE